MIVKYVLKEWAVVFAGALVALKVDWITTDIQIRVLIGALTVIILVPKTVKSIVWLIQFFRPKDKK